MNTSKSSKPIYQSPKSHIAQLQHLFFQNNRQSENSKEKVNNQNDNKQVKVNKFPACHPSNNSKNKEVSYKQMTFKKFQDNFKQNVEEKIKQVFNKKSLNNSKSSLNYPKFIDSPQRDINNSQTLGLLNSIKQNLLKKAEKTEVRVQKQMKKEQSKTKKNNNHSEKPKRQRSERQLTSKKKQLINTVDTIKQNRQQKNIKLYFEKKKMNKNEPNQNKNLDKFFSHNLDNNSNIQQQQLEKNYVSGNVLNQTNNKQSYEIINLLVSELRKFLENF